MRSNETHFHGSALTISHNQAEQGGGVYNTADKMVLEGCNLTYNNATGNKRGFAGAALYNTGHGYLMNQTLIMNNSAPNSTGRSLYNGGKLYSVLPLPLGFHVSSVFQCHLLKCDSPFSDDDGAVTASSDCATQNCDWETWGGYHMSRVEQGPDDHISYPRLCTEGSMAIAPSGANKILTSVRVYARWGASALARARSIRSHAPKVAGAERALARPFRARKGRLLSVCQPAHQLGCLQALSR